MELTSKEFEYKFLKAKTESKKVMIVMHGLGDSLESYIPLVKELEIDDLNYFLINAPLDYPIGSSWYDIPPGNPQAGIEMSCEKIKKLISELAEQGIDRSDLFIMGFSQGGCIALEFLSRTSDILAGVVALSPRIYLNTDNLKTHFFKVPLFAAHGEYDPVIPFKETAHKINAIEKDHSDLVFKSYPMEHSICLEELQELKKWLKKKV